jgi:hypothetical protein
LIYVAQSLSEMRALLRALSFQRTAYPRELWTCQCSHSTFSSPQRSDWRRCEHKPTSPTAMSVFQQASLERVEDPVCRRQPPARNCRIGRGTGVATRPISAALESRSKGSSRERSAAADARDGFNCIWPEAAFPPNETSVELDRQTVVGRRELHDRAKLSYSTPRSRRGAVTSAPGFDVKPAGRSSPSIGRSDSNS